MGYAERANPNSEYNRRMYPPKMVETKSEEPALNAKRLTLWQRIMRFIFGYYWRTTNG